MTELEAFAAEMYRDITGRLGGRQHGVGKTIYNLALTACKLASDSRVLADWVKEQMAVDEPFAGDEPVEVLLRRAYDLVVNSQVISIT